MTSTAIVNTSTAEDVTGKNKEDTTQNVIWIPVEANTEVFNSWAEQAGLITKKDRFVDIYGIDDDFLSIVPQPTKSVILLFPDNVPIKDKQVNQDARIVMDGQYPIDETLFFVKQEKENQCGTVALINAIANASVTYTPDSPLQRFIEECKDKSPEERSQILSNTNLFSNINIPINNSTSTRFHPFQSHKPINDEEEKTKYHFSCFVTVPDPLIKQAERDKQNIENGGVGESSITNNHDHPRINYIPPPIQPLSRVDQMVATLKAKWEAENPLNKEFKLEGMRLIELDGRRPYPVDHGPCTDLLDDTVELIKKYYFSLTETVYFSILSFGAAPSPTSAFYPTQP